MRFRSERAGRAEENRVQGWEHGAESQTKLPRTTLSNT